MKEHGGELFREAKPELYKRVHDMSAVMIDFLKGGGIVVHRPREHAPDEWANFALQSKYNLNGYNRDSLVTIGKTLVECSLKVPERLRNKYAVRQDVRRQPPLQYVSNLPGGVGMGCRLHFNYSLSS